MIKCSNAELIDVVTTANLLDLLKEKLGSDYKTAKALGVTTQRISQLRTRGGTFTDTQGLKAAEILDFPQELVVLSLAAERSLNSPAFGILTHLASQFDHRKVGSFLVLALVPIFAVFYNLTSVVS
jgi:hypothetical protein